MRKKRQGFTLIEIIVVLVILGILLAIATPSILGYVQKAKDSRLLQEARHVLVVSKDYGLRLHTKEELQNLSTDEVMEKIMKDAEVEGELLEIHLNKAQDNAGDFIVKIEDKYLSYNDEKQEFSFLKSYDNAFVKANKIIKQLLNQDKEAYQILYSYYYKADQTPNKTGALDSEGPNFGSKIRAELEKNGIDADAYSFRIYNDNNNCKITIATRRITIADTHQQQIDIVQYDYGKGGKFHTEPTIKKGKVPVVIKKTEDQSTHQQVTYPVLDVEHATWE